MIDKNEPNVQQLIDDKYQELRAIEDRNRLLRDRSIGGDLAPRPSPEFIENNIQQRPRTDEELRQEAQETVLTQMRDEHQKSTKAAREFIEQEQQDKIAKKREELRIKFERDRQQERDLDR